MTSIDFPQDTSIQLPYTSFPFTITNADGYITSNVLELQKYINSNSITDILSSYATNTNLNLKENALTFTSPLFRTTNTVGIDLSSYSTNTNTNTAITTALNSYTPTTALNNYTSNFNGWTKTGNDVYRTITGGNTMIGSTTNLGGYKLLVSGSGNFGSCLSVGFGNMLNIQPNISGTNFLILKHNTFNGLIGPNYPNPECFFIMGNNSSGGAIPWGFYSGVCKYFASSTPINSLRYDIGSCYINNTLATLTGTNTFSPLLSMLFNGNVGIGSSFPAYKLDVNGTTNSLNIFKNGIDIDNIFISSNTLQIQNYINSNSIQDNLSFYISCNIIANVLMPYDTILDRNTALSAYPNYSYLNAYTSNYISSNIIANLLLPYATNTNLNLKENILTFNAPLTRSVNTISLNLSGYLTTSTASSTYLPLSGGTLTGNITINTANSGIILINGSGAAFGQASGAGAYSTSSAIGDAILRSQATKQLILQSGSGGSAIIISSVNNVSITNTLNATTLQQGGVGVSTLITNALTSYLPLTGGTISSTLNVNGILNANYPDIRINAVNGVTLLSLEARIMGTNGYSACFGGDMYETSYWGKCICINGGGLADNASATATKIQYTSSFSIYTRSSGASTYFDKNLFVVRNSGNVGIGTTNPSQLLDVRGTIISQNLIIGDSTSYSSQYQLFFIPPTSTTSAQIQTIQQGVNYNQNLNLQPNGGTITLTGATNLGGVLTVLKNNWIMSSDNIARIYFEDNSKLYFHSGATSGIAYVFRSFNQLTDILTIDNSGNIVSTGSITNGSSSYIYAGGLRIGGFDTGNTVYQATGDLGITTNTTNINLGMNTYGTKVQISPTNTTIYNNLILNSSLTFKTDVWNNSSDNNQRLYFGNAGITYYQGYGQYALDINHEWRNHQGNQKMRLDNSGNLKLQGSLQCNFLTIANTNRDLTGIAVEYTAVNDINNTVLYCIQGTFTGFHRVFTDDELYDNNNPQQFKDDYEGRIVISNGKIATDTTDNGIENNTEWEILYDKAGITIEDALPKIELSRTKKDKRVFGVLGDKRRHNNRPERMIVNSVGEGGIWICNSNGNIENGDYITSSDYLGYGEKQDDDLLHNYTVAKATIDCNFELDSQYYKCFEIDDLDVNNNKLRIAFIACTYHCA